jgi:hypothetical protein
MGRENFETMYAKNDTIARGGKDFCCCDGWWAGIARKGVLSSYFSFGYCPLDEMTYLSPLLVLSLMFSAQR